MKKITPSHFIKSILLLIVVLISSSFTRRMFFKQASTPESICTGKGGSWDSSTGGGSCLFSSGLSSTICSSKNYSNTVQYYVPGNSGSHSSYVGGYNHDCFMLR